MLLPPMTYLRMESEGIKTTILLAHNATKDGAAKMIGGSQ
jgi:hypothetical protein